MGATLHCGVWASHGSGFSCFGARALGMQASVVAARGLSSCGAQALEHAGFSSWACVLSSCSSQALEHGLSSCGARA